MKKNTILFVAAALLSVLSCVRDSEVEQERVSTGYELQFRTEVDGMLTKAAGDPVADVHSLQEDVVNTLDVYIYGVFKGAALPSVKGFHLTTADKVGDNWIITPDWRKENIVAGNDYKLYVAANSSKVKTSADCGTANATQTLEVMAITSAEDLGNAIEFDYDPSVSNGVGGTKPFWGSNNDDGVNPAWLGVHKKYTSTGNITDVNAKADRYFTNEKVFLMNGTSSTFTVNASVVDNSVPTVNLSRAASKINLNVTFDPTFLSKLSSEKNMTLDGDPHWRFYNFAFNTPIFSDLSQDGYNPKVSWFTSAADLIGYGAIDGNDLVYALNGEGKQSFSFSTYSYPLSWTAETAGKDAPAIIVTVGYKNTSTSKVSYQSYKIPVVNPDLSVYSLERNKIYTINANISSEGSSLATDAFEIKAAYSIMDWGGDASASSISDRDNSYIDVIPDAITETTNVTDVILRGNGEQTFRLHVLKPDTKSFSIAYFGTTGASRSNPFGQTATPTDYAFSGNYTDESGHTYTGCAAMGASVPYYINLHGDISNTIGGAGIQNCFVKDGDDIVIISEALPNKGVKYMKIRVFLDGHKTDAGKYMDVNIRHYPTDALMAIQGRWSSRQSAAVVAGKITSSQVIPSPEDIFNAAHSDFTSKIAGTDNKSIYDSWDGYKIWRWEQCTAAEYEAATERRIQEGVVITREDYTANLLSGNYVNGTARDGFEKHTGTYPDPLYQKDGSRTLISNGLSNTYFQTATSELNSKIGSTSDPNYPTYYWGEDVTTSTISNIDYYIASPRAYYLYSKRYYVYYTGNRYYRKMYYHLDPSKDASVWPNWVKDYGKTTFTAGAHFNLSNTSSTYAARIITDVISGSNGAVTTDNAGVQKVTKGINWDANPIATSTASGYYSTAIGDWCMFFGAREGSSMTFEAAKNSRDASKNRYMYVLQLSESSSEYTIGRPILEDDYTSKDNVVSPAIMIASQLGSTSGSLSGTYAGKWAALHCATYLEVSSDGTYYMGWRLPTKAEIQTIINYQGSSSGIATLVPGSPVSGNDRVMEPVLFAQAYYALDGSTVLTNYGGGSSETTVRCVRDLSPEEIEALNN